MKIKDPFIIVFENDGEVQTRLYHSRYGVQRHGILIADLVRHASNAFRVPENDVWEWVDKERNHPTSAAKELKPN